MVSIYIFTIHYINLTYKDRSSPSWRKKKETLLTFIRDFCKKCVAQPDLSLNSFNDETQRWFQHFYSLETPYIQKKIRNNCFKNIYIILPYLQIYIITVFFYNYSIRQRIADRLESVGKKSSFLFFSSILFIIFSFLSNNHNWPLTDTLTLPFTSRDTPCSWWHFIRDIAAILLVPRRLPNEI